VTHSALQAALAGSTLTDTTAAASSDNNSRQRLLIVGLNAAMQRWFQMKAGSVVIDEVNRAAHSGCGPGGKGQNAATALTQSHSSNSSSDCNISSTSTSSSSNTAHDSSRNSDAQHNSATAATTASSKSSAVSSSNGGSTQQSTAAAAAAAVRAVAAVQVVMFGGTNDATAQSVVQMLQHRGVSVIAGNTAAEMRTCVTLLSSSNTESDSSSYGKQQQGATEIVGPWGGSVTEGNN
jgi:uncharacterized protein